MLNDGRRVAIKVPLNVQWRLNHAKKKTQKCISNIFLLLPLKLNSEIQWNLNQVKIVVYVILLMVKFLKETK